MAHTVNSSTWMVNVPERPEVQGQPWLLKICSSFCALFLNLINELWLCKGILLFLGHNNKLTRRAVFLCEHMFYLCGYPVMPEEGVKSPDAEITVFCLLFVF